MRGAKISRAHFLLRVEELFVANSILLINPNSNAQTTEAMVEIATECTQKCQINGVTMASVPPIITTPEALDQAAKVVGAFPIDEAYHAVVVAAFGDPGQEALRARLSVPVVGIAEASMLEAGRDGRRFSVATTTPALEQRIAERAASLGFGEACVSVRFTPGDPFVVMSNAERLVTALAKTIDQCILDGAEAVIIGGGPLAKAARVLKADFTVPIIEPIVSAVALAETRIMDSL